VKTPFSLVALLLTVVLVAGVPAATTGADSDGPDDGPDLSGLGWVVDSFLAKRELAGARVGVLVVLRDGGATLFEENADLPMVPASNMKIVTGAAALSLLGPDYRFETVFATDGEIDGGVLEGDLYVVGSGDPSIVSEELWKIAEEVRLLGIETIAGDLVLDTSYFDSLTVASHDAANGQRAYHARTGAVSLNFNSIAVHVFPGTRSGDPARVELAPATGYVEVRNEARTGGRSASTLSIKRTYDGGRNVITVTGRIPASAARKTVYRNLEGPSEHFGTVLVEFLAGAGVEVTGGVRTGEAPADADVLFVHESKPLSLVVRDLSKFSNNFVAEQLVKTLSAEIHGPPGTTQGGVRVLEEFLASAGADSGSFRVADGSGLSRDNRLSPRAIVRTLEATLDDFESSYEYVASLSVSGTDGTLEDRMGYAGVDGAVRAKTGLLDGVTAISGLMQTLAGDEVLFSILVNGFDDEAWHAHDLEHAILTSISGASARRD
jgi:D-alanyl-D-alanine carboxypeptidase/D-alanyl-D-alanine-endopeptidase (penicillin-binding protein 4)